jgi:hypothetical protein
VSQLWASKPRPDRRNTAEPEESVTVSQLWASRRRADRRNTAEPEESVTVSQLWAHHGAAEALALVAVSGVSWTVARTWSNHDAESNDRRSLSSLETYSRIR